MAEWPHWPKCCLKAKWISQGLSVIGGFGVSEALIGVAGTWKTDLTCLITDVPLAARPLQVCNYGPVSHFAAWPARNT